MAENDVRINVSADTTSAQRGIETLGQRMDRLRPQIRQAGVALTAFGAAGALMAKSFIGAALEQQKAERTLAAVVEQTGVSWESQRESILAVTAALQDKTNFGDEEQIRALSILTTALGSSEKAIQALPLALDAASASGKSLGTVVNTLGRALAGQTDVSISLNTQFEKGSGFADRLALGFSKVGGAAEASADPFTQLGNAVGDLKESIGAALIPILEPFVGMLKSVAERLQTLNPLVVKIGSAVFLAATAFAAIGGPMLIFLSFLPRMATGLAMVQKAFIALRAVMMNQFTLVIVGAIVALEGLIRALNVIPGIDIPTPMEMAGKAIGKLGSLLGEAMPNVDAFSTGLDSIGAAASSASVPLNDFVSAIEEGRVKIQRIVPEIKDAGAALRDAFRVAATTSVGGSGVDTGFQELASTLTATFEDTAKAVGEAAGTTTKFLTAEESQLFLVQLAIDRLTESGLTYRRASEEVNAALKDGISILDILVGRFGAFLDVSDRLGATSQTVAKLLSKQEADTRLMTLAVNKLVAEDWGLVDAENEVRAAFEQTGDPLAAIRLMYEGLSPVIEEVAESVKALPRIMNDSEAKTRLLTIAALRLPEALYDIPLALSLVTEAFENGISSGREWMAVMSEILKGNLDGLADKSDGKLKLGDPRSGAVRGFIGDLHQSGLDLGLAQGQAYAAARRAGFTGDFNQFLQENRGRDFELTTFNQTTGEFNTRVIEVHVSIDGREIATALGINAENEESYRGS